MRRIPIRRQHAWVLAGLMLATVITVAGFGLALKASAQTSFSVESIGGQVGLGNADLRQVILNVIRWVLGILTLTAVVYMMYGGYLWLTAAGREQQVEKAKQVILQAAIGLVIILLAWAIVFFVARSVANTTNVSNTNTNGGGTPCNPLIEECGIVTSFDITNVASCAVGNPNENVPRSSAMQLTFNANLKAGAVQQAVVDDLTNANPPNLIVQKCANNDCTNPANLSTPVPLENQKFVAGTTPTTTGTPQADWIQNGKTITFYHVANDTVAADARLFEANQKYLLTVPAKTASKALLDVTDRSLQNCRRSPSDITSLPGCDATGNDRVTWEFTTGADTDGPALNVSSTFPSSSYQTTTATPNRAVSRSSFLSIQYSTTIDFNTLSTGNFKVFKCTDTPTSANDWNECDNDTANQINAANFAVEPLPNGTGGILRIVQPSSGQAPFRYDGFTWYKVEVSGVRSLCGRTQEPPTKTWVFQTNDSVPGVKQVYPRDGYQNACPATRVFIQYATSMWDGSSFDCNVGAGSYVASGTLTNNPGRNFIPTSAFDPNDPNTCSMYEFAPTSTLLPPNTNYEARVESDLVIDNNGRHLNYGYTVAGDTSEGPWAFKTATAATCAQEPVITKISPAQGADGQCLSVIGDYFEKVNYPDTVADAPDPGDKLELRATNQTADTWENSYIVSTVTAGSLATNVNQPYTVTVSYPAPIGPLTSAPENFYLTDDPGTQGPCLTKISPTSGPVNTTVTATGKRFGASQGSGSVYYSTLSAPGQWIVNGPWSDTKIDNIIVRPGSPTGLGDVTVVDGSGNVSNALPYNVKTSTTAPGTAPQIIESTTCSTTTSPSPNPRRGETQACINAWPSARFSVTVDPATVNPTNIILEQCDAAYASCSVVSGATVAPFVNNLGFRINPGANLQPATAYRVRVGVGIMSTDGVAMATPYEWRFTTKSGTAPCPISQVIIQQSDQVFRNPFALGLPTEVMDTACNTVNGNGLTYAWSNSNPLICALRSGNTGPADICTSPDPIVDQGDTLVHVCLPTENNLCSNDVRITVNVVACTTSAQCACGGNTVSQCVGGSCTPVVTSLTPDNGRVGTWTTIQGCWFGQYNSASKVIFTNNKDGLVPTSTSNACTAGNTWSNTQIVREVPKLELPTNDTTNDAVTGPIRVVRSDGASVAGPIFTVNAEEYPKLCRIDRSSATPGQTVTVYGQELGATQGAGDKVEITDNDTPTITPFASYLQWIDDRIGLVVPNPGAAVNVFGPGNVRATHLGKVSNPLSLTLVNPAVPTTGGGTGTCATADLCIYGDDTPCGAGRGCGFNNCCAARPVVVPPTRPADGETDVCRNTQVQVDFSQPLLSSTVNTTTVRYLDGSSLVNGKVTLRNNPTTITYEPGLLSPNLDQHLKFTSPVETPVTVTNPSFESATAGVIQGWNVGTNVSQSSDHPSGAGGFSALADCTVSGCTQSDISQNIGTASTTIRSYRVTGWVKVEYTANQGTNKGGLITRCDGSGAGSCTQANSTKTFDLWDRAPGIFDAPTNGWRKIDFQINNSLGLNIRPQLDCFARPGMKVWCDEIVMTQVTEQPSLLRGTSGVAADLSGFRLDFTSSTAICALDRVVVTPSTKVLTASGQRFTPDPLAQAFSGRRSAPLAQVPGVYQWDWRWERIGGSDTIATVANQNSPTTIVTAGTVNGKIAARAIAKVTVDSNNNATVGREALGQSQVTVDFCENPFVFTDTSGNCGSGGTCQNFHFKMYYCPSSQEPLLQHQAIEGRNATDPTRRKSFFLKESVTSQDVIGILVFENPQLLSPYDWFTLRFPGTQPGSSSIIGGFPAVRTGTTAYIGVTDLTDANRLEGYMFVIDFNSNSASPVTKSIYNRLLASLEFNATQAISNDDRTAIASDTRRVQDLRTVKTLLESYKTANGHYPDLLAGSFITGFSTSAWPSWQGELANVLGRTLPTDPINTFTAGVCQPPYEAASCWAESLKRFQCPTDSHIYSYKSSSGGGSFELFAHLDYTFAGSFTNYSGNPCSGLGSGNTCACFNYRLSIP